MSATPMKMPQSLKPGGKSLAEWMESRTARLSTRCYDWNALKFQADFDPKYRRAQMRYLGMGGTGVKTDESVAPAEHFTFLTMVMPAGSQGPMHLHVDAEEVFFILKGSKVVFTVQCEGETWETYLGERDLITIPAGVYREVRNDGSEEALVCTMIGNPTPVRPTYPPDHPLAQIRRQLQGD